MVLKRSKKAGKKASKKKVRKQFTYAETPKTDYKLIDSKFSGKDFKNKGAGGDRCLSKGKRPTARVEVSKNFFGRKRIGKFRKDLKDLLKK